MSNGSLFVDLVSWVERTPAIDSAILFGSQARASETELKTTVSDFDLHVISKTPLALESVDWAGELPNAGFEFHAVRPATGGVRKVTAIFAQGQIDLVIVPRNFARLGEWVLRFRLYRRLRGAKIALDEMATCLWTGYRFLKGERRWGKFYSTIADRMAGVRLDDAEIGRMADAFLTDFLWLRQKADHREFVAAQHVLHRQLSETNLRLFRELRLRRGLPLRSFGLGRRVETYATSEELRWLTVDAGLDSAALLAAGENSLAGLRALMRELVPAWRVPPAFEARLGAAASVKPAR